MIEEADKLLSNDTKALENQGWKLLEKKQYDQAGEVFDKIFMKEPKNVAAFQGKIASLRKKAEFEKAFVLLEAALKEHPNEAGILSEKACIFEDQKKYDEAICALDEVLNAKWNEDVFLWEINLLKNQCRLEDAINLINKAIKDFHESPRILNELGWVHFDLKHYDEAIESFKDVINRDPNNESALQGQIASLRMRGYYTEATDKAIEALAQPQLTHSPGINCELGWINFEQDKYNEAEQYFSKVVDLTLKQDPFAHIHLAWSLFRQGKDINLDNAVKHCHTALKLEPNLAEAFGCLGNIAYKRKRILEAEEYFLRSIQQVNVKKGHYADLGALYIEMGRYKEAKDNLESALKNNPNDAYAHLEMGDLYLQTDQVKEAISEFRSATVINPHKPNSFKGLAIALMADNRLTEAEKVIRNAIKSLDESKRCELHLMLCRILTRIGDEKNNPMYYEEALKEVNLARPPKPMESEQYFYEGVVRFKLEDYRKALNSFQNCLKLNSNYIDAESNARRVQSILKETNRSRVSGFASIFLAIIFLTQLIALWIFRFMTDGITNTELLVLLPILLGLMIVSILLPGLTRLKMTGFEVELCEPAPKESIRSGPKGIIEFNQVGLSLTDISD